MDSGHVLGAISPFASGQSRTSLDWIENDTDMGNFAREILEGEMSLDQDLFKGLPTPDFGYAASGQGAPDKVRTLLTSLPAQPAPMLRVISVASAGFGADRLTNAGTVLHFTCQRASATDRCGARERDRQRLCILQYRAIISKSVAKP